MKGLTLGCVLSIVLFTSCSTSKPEEKAIYPFASLLGKQLGELGRKTIRLSKVEILNGKSDSTSIQDPDSLLLANEFGLLLELDNLNKPDYRDEYTIDTLRDPNSNLMILKIYAIQKATTMRSKEPTVRTVEIFYEDDPLKPRKILGLIDSRNLMYASQRRIQVELNPDYDFPLIRSVKIEGGQKILGGDSTIYQIDSHITIR